MMGGKHSRSGRVAGAPHIGYGMGMTAILPYDCGTLTQILTLRVSACARARVLSRAEPCKIVCRSLLPVMCCLASVVHVIFFCFGICAFLVVGVFAHLLQRSRVYFALLLMFSFVLL